MVRHWNVQCFGRLPRKFLLDEGDVVEVVGKRARNSIEIYVARNISKDSNVLPAWPVKLVAALVCAAAAVVCGLYVLRARDVGASGIAIAYQPLGSSRSSPQSRSS